MRLFSVPRQFPGRDASLRQASWSRDFRHFLRRWEAWLPDLPAPSLVRAGGVRDYPDTYDLPVTAVPDRALRRDARRWARVLHGHPTPRAVVMLQGILDDLSSRGLRRLLAMFRSELVRLNRDGSAALYAPPPTPPARGEFPAHADLWKGEMLLNVFDRVSPAGGDAQFWSVRRLLEHVQDRKVQFPVLAADLRTLLCGRHRDGNYARLFVLLHGSGQHWTDDLADFFADNATCVPVRPGDGYLIHDRRWLHGRTTIERPVSGCRFHRLVFNTRTLQAKVHFDS